jgi:bifunctional non-homologous end joining protein LigD
VLFGFDLPFGDGRDLRRLPLIERRGKLRQVIPIDSTARVQFSDHWEGDGAALFQKVCAMGLEGIVSKRAAAPYKSGPSKLWLKTKNVTESTLILFGTDHDREGKPIAYIGRELGGELRYVGTAFLTLASGARQRLEERLPRLCTDKASMPLHIARRPSWLKPGLPVRVRHLQGSDALRHATVIGLAAQDSER